MQQTTLMQTNKLLEQIHTVYHRTTMTVFQVRKVLAYTFNPFDPEQPFPPCYSKGIFTLLKNSCDTNACGDKMTDFRGFSGIFLGAAGLPEESHNSEKEEYINTTFP